MTTNCQVRTKDIDEHSQRAVVDECRLINCCRHWVVGKRSIVTICGYVPFGTRKMDYVKVKHYTPGVLGAVEVKRRTVLIDFGVH